MWHEDIYGVYTLCCMHCGLLFDEAVVCNGYQCQEQSTFKPPGFEQEAVRLLCKAFPGMIKGN